MKKFAMILLCVALVFSCTVIAFADPTPTYSITIDGAKPSQTYTAYKIFDVSYDSTKTNFTYTVSSGSEWWSALTTPSTAGQNPNLNADQFTVDGLIFTKTAATDANSNPIYIVSYDENTIDTDAEREELARTLADKLYAAVDNNKTPAGSQQSSSSTPSTAVISLTEDGYYFVTTTVGALCGLNTTSTTATVEEKNDLPTIVKKVSNDNSTWVSAPGGTNVGFGDDVYFEIDITDGIGTDKTMTLTDEMTSGIDLKIVNGNNDITVVVGGTEIQPGENTYSVTVTNSHRFVIEFAPAFVASLTPPAANSTTPSVIVTYTGVLNTSAHIKGNEDDTSTTPAQEALNTNTATLTYAGLDSSSTVYVETYKFDIVKTDTGSNIIYTANFDLYDDYDASDATVGNKIDVVLIDTEYFTDPTTGDPTTEVKSRTYRKAVAGDTNIATTIEAGIAHLIGFGSDTYWVEETAAPEGYNPIDGRTQFSLGTANNTATLTDNDTRWAANGGGLHVENETGSQMPSTGGIGTYLFYGVGAILVVGAVVVLVSKKRMHAYSD